MCLLRAIVEEHARVARQCDGKPCRSVPDDAPSGFVGSIAEFRDVDAFRRIVRRSKKMGLRGATCIHPNQVRICNEEFGPSEAETEEARRIVAAYDEALARGDGAITVDGKLVDVPVAERARAVLRIAGTLAARQPR